ncbi:MAG: 50S ribosomal protein L22 [Deltaproteobacteria bacterium]|nr:MAG: 50S ribosomal protein L22 [Deltaproteobacteria bacterium]
MEARAVLRYARISPLKARLVVDLIRGKDVNSALTILNFSKKKAAKIVKKVLESAIANAVQTGEIDPDNLYVKRAFVDQGPVMKRYRAAAMGRAHMIRKRTSHITIILDER